MSSKAKKASTLMMYRKGPQNEVNVSEVDKGTVREHLVGLDHAAKLRPDTFKGGLDVVVPVDVFHGGDNDSYHDQDYDDGDDDDDDDDDDDQDDDAVADCHLMPRLQSSIRIVRKPSSSAWKAVEAGKYIESQSCHRSSRKKHTFSNQKS